MEFLVITRRQTDCYTEAEFDEHLPAETDTMRRLYAADHVRRVWLRSDVRGAAFLLEADSLLTARRIVDRLPLAQRQMSHFDIIPLGPYRGFGPRD